MANATLKHLFIEEMRDTYSSETQVLQNFGTMAAAATSPKLKQVFQAHERESRTHLERLTRAFDHLLTSPEGNTCEATQGLLAEVKEVLGEGMPKELLDVALVMGAQKIEHYEIASYGSLKAIAESCSLDPIATLLGETLEEEKAQDAKLTQLAESDVNKAAAAAAR